jgi:Kef-type K+ transport system membrane component KefB
VTPLELSARFFLQLAVIAAAGQLCARLGRRLLQPPVVCEMVAGVLLGPSLLGWLAPEVSAWIFPPEGMPILFAASQLGLALYMFCVGLELRTELLREGWRGSLAVSWAGIAAPLVLGGGLGVVLHGMPGFFGAGVSRQMAALFGGSAVCITAFPMLARIIVERGLAGTRLGTVALAAGAFDDLAAWAVLAVLLSMFSSNAGIAGLAIGGGLAFAAVVYLVVRPCARRLLDWAGPAALGPEGVAIGLVVLCVAAWATDTIRLYSVFGAFTLGLAVPRGLYCDRLRERVEPLTTALLVPTFFAFSGLSTRIGLLDSGGLWVVAGVVLLVSTVGKGVACGLAARATGLGAAESAAVGALMNARGLMELILLNIVFQRGVITQATFTIYVLMAVTTTLAASPVFELVRPYLPAASLKPSRALEASRRSG